MVVGAYWSEREESRDAAAERITIFLKAVAQHSTEFSTWFSKAYSRRAALRSPLTVNHETIARKLRANHRDTDRQPIPELGFSLGLWNGGNTSFSAHVGAYSPYASNSATLSYNPPVAFNREFFRLLLEEMIRAFEPDHAVVTSTEHMARVNASHPWEAGWLTYERGDEIREHPFP